MSWELTYKPNKVYRLVSENQMENLKELFSEAHAVCAHAIKIMYLVIF